MKAKSHPSAAEGEKALYERIRELIVTTRQTVARGVDLVQVHTNFEIGRHIIENEQQGKQRATYGKALLKSLAEKLSAEFGPGFSVTNLKLMRQFYIANNHRIGQTASDLLNQNAISQLPSDLLTAAKREFNSSLYERLALSRDKDGVRQLARDGQIVSHPKDLLKEPLVLEFLGLAEQTRYSESDLETAIIGQIERFLLELGKAFF